jgi:tRNA pseudouridine13 synthase
MSSHLVHEREQDDADIERYSKRCKADNDVQESISTSSSTQTTEHILPPSHALLGIPLPDTSPLNLLEADVGISEYIGREEAKIEGIIKQRFAIPFCDKFKFYSLCQVHRFLGV